MNANWPYDDEPRGGGTPLWYITFSDLMAILVGFFILLFGFSTMESNRFKQIAGSMREAFGTPQPRADIVTTPSIHDGIAAPDKVSIFEKLKTQLAPLALGENAEASIEEHGVRLRLSGELLFGAGSAALSSAAAPVLDRVARAVAQGGGDVVVEGHSDNLPIRSDVFPSNWELAGARAGAVVRYLESRGLPGIRLTATAYADTRPRASNAEDAGRAKNRRVEILIRTDRSESGPRS